MHVLGEVHMPYVLLGDSGLEAFLRRVPYMRPFLMKMHVRWSNFSRALSRVLRYGVGPGTYPYRAGAPGHGELSQHNRAGLPFRSFLITAADEFHPANKYADYFDCIYDEDNHAHLRDSASRQDVERCFYEIAMPDDLNAPPMTLTPANADLCGPRIVRFTHVAPAGPSRGAPNTIQNRSHITIFDANNRNTWQQIIAGTRKPQTRRRGRTPYLAAAVKLHGRTRFTNIMNYITTTKAEESRAYIWDPRLDGKIKLVGTDEYIRRNPGIARKPFVRPFVVWSTDFKDLRTNEPTGLARFGHIQAGTEVDAINEIHYGWPSNRHLNKLANADCKPILGVGYFSATMRNHRPPLRLSAAPCRARPFAATDVLMNVHRRTTTRKRPRLKRTAPLPPASVISGSTPCTPYEQSYLASLRVCAARMLGFDDVEDPLDVPLFGDGGPSVPHPIARMTDTNRTLRERINDGRICVNLHIAAIDHRRQVLQYLLTKALVDTGAAADVLDGSIADKLPGLRYSNAPRVHLTGFGTDMTAYARIAFIAIKVGPVTIPRKVLVVAPGLMGNTPMLLGLTTLVALNAHIVLDPANWGMTITRPTVPIASVNADARMEPPSSDTAPPTKPSPETIKAMVDALLKPSESNPDALPEDRTQLQNLLTQRQHCFAQNINPRELLKYKHSIRLLPGVPAKHLPLYTVPRRLSPPAEKAAKAEIEKLLRDGLIEPSQAGFGSPVVLAPKKDGTMRFCVDYRKLNSLTERDVFPLPRIEDQLERLQVTPFGITNGPAAFCRAVTSILGNLLSTCVVAYVDDLTVHSPNVKQHLLDLEAFFAAIDRGNLKLKPSKCRFMVREVELLGFRVSSDGIRMDPKKVEIISKITANELQTVEQLRSFLGLTGFYRRFVQSYARRELSLRDLLTDALRADRLNLVWNDEALAALDDLKKAMCEDIVLMLPDFTKPFIIYTDWSKRAMGAVLMQEDKDGRERSIAFISRTLTNMERKYQSPTEGECIAVLWAVKVWHHYFVCGHPFTIRTDHSALQWLKTQELANNKTLGRAAIALNHYNYTIEYRNGRSNVTALTGSVCPMRETTTIHANSTASPSPHLLGPATYSGRAGVDPYWG
eukprot:tig00001052_g6620.t1